MTGTPLRRNINAGFCYPQSRVLIVDFIKQQWGEKTAKEFIQKVDEIFNLLKEYPLMAQIENKDIRGFQLSRQTRVLYRVRENKIIILSSFDVRQDPKKKLG